MTSHYGSMRASNTRSGSSLTGIVPTGTYPCKVCSGGQIRALFLCKKMDEWWNIDSPLKKVAFICAVFDVGRVGGVQMCKCEAQKDK